MFDPANPWGMQGGANAGFGAPGADPSAGGGLGLWNILNGGGGASGSPQAPSMGGGSPIPLTGPMMQPGAGSAPPTMMPWGNQTGTMTSQPGSPGMPQQPGFFGGRNNGQSPNLLSLWNLINGMGGNFTMGGGQPGAQAGGQGGFQGGSALGNFSMMPGGFMPNGTAYR